MGSFGRSLSLSERSKAARPQANCPPAPSVLGSGYKSCSFERGLGCMWQLQEAPFGSGVPPEQQAGTEHHSKHIPMAAASQGPPLLPAPQHPPRAHPRRGLGPLPHSRYPRERPCPLFGGAASACPWVRGAGGGHSLRCPLRALAAVPAQQGEV